MINRAVAIHTFQQHHWIRIALLVIILLFVFIFSQGIEDFPLIPLTPFFVWVLGSGIIGRDMSSGVSHLLFTRPITRLSYILTKWLSLTAAVWGFQILVLLIWVCGTLFYNTAHVINLNLFQALFISMWMASTLSTVVILFSTIMAGWGDLALLFFVHVTLGVLGMRGLSDPNSLWKNIVEWLTQAVWPGVSTGTHFMSKSYPDPMEYVLFSGIALLYLLAAFTLLSRKDITYTAE